MSQKKVLYLESISKNGEAFVGEMVLRNEAGDVCDLTSILLGDIEDADYFQVDNGGKSLCRSLPLE